MLGGCKTIPSRCRSPKFGYAAYAQQIASTASVAHLDRVLGFEPSGREFESLRTHQYYQASLDQPLDQLLLNRP